MLVAPKQNHLLIIEDDKGQRHHTLEGSVYTIGRDLKCDICLASLFVSRRHATLVKLPKENGSYYYRIQDGSLKGKPSVNGLLVNGHKLQCHNLQNKDVVVFGPSVRIFYFVLEEDELVNLDPDELDIPEFDDVTLIDPKMVGVSSED
jgi:pSer/pThr/pTyr-binding forkhead associated (FHA) protein